MLWWIGLLGVIAVMVQPVSVTLTRMAAAGGLIALWLAALVLVWKSRRLFLAVLLVGLVPAIWLMLPGREVDTSALRNSYVNHLQRYEGTRYVWGGENGRGVDCSGLVRRALINANLERGLMTLNPELVRRAISMAWKDCSALSLKDGAGGLTKKVGESPSINSMEDLAVLPGTLAVTRNGVHVLAYMGKRGWIQASPGIGKVVLLEGPSDNSWYDVPVVLVEWTQLSDPRIPAVRDLH